MKKILIIIVLLIIFCSCTETTESEDVSDQLNSEIVNLKTIIERQQELIDSYVKDGTEINEGEAYDSFEISSNIFGDIGSIYTHYDSFFLSHAYGVNAPMYRFPNSNIEPIGIVNDKVLIFSTYQVWHTDRTIEIWAYVEYVGDNDNDMTSDQCGYIMLNDLEIINPTYEEIKTIGFNDIFIGSRYEKVFSEFGNDFLFVKDDYKEWYMYYHKHNLHIYIDPVNLCVERITIENPILTDIQLTDGLSTKSSWDEIVHHIEEEGNDYEVFMLEGSQMLEGIIDSKIKVRFQRLNEKAQISFLEISIIDAKTNNE